MRSRERLLALLPPAALAAAIVLLAGPTLGQGSTEPQGELSNALCYGHHRAEGFRSVDLFPETVTQVEKGKPFQFKLTIRNPWLHDLLNVTGFVNVTNAKGVRFIGEKDPFHLEQEGRISAAVGGAAPIRFPFDVEENATELRVRLEGTPGLLRTNDFDLALVTPRSRVIATPEDEGTDTLRGSSAATPWRESLHLGQADIAANGTGEYAAVVHYAGGADPEGVFRVAVDVYYNLSRSTAAFVKGPERVGRGETHTFTFELVAPDADASAVDLVYGTVVTAHHEHTDANAQDYGDYTKWNTLRFEVGSETIIGTQSVVLGPLARDPGPLMRAWGQILGFTGSFMLVPSLVLGGTFGRGSILWLNRLLGSPRRRVLWHNSASFVLLGTSLLHMTLFFAESFWEWSHGMVWGGLSLACMVGLGFSGAMQKRFVARWGFDRWRFTHFTLGTLVVVFVLAHLMVDGTHLGPFREFITGGSA